MGWRIPLHILCVAPALALAACNSDGLELPASLSTARAQADDVASARPPAGPYKLGLNDMVRVKAYNEPEISGEYSVDSTGFISVPLAGRVKAVGLTPQQLQHSIMSQLTNGVIRDPHVTVEVSTYTPFYIQGEVKRGGEFAYRPGLSVADAVAQAGGFTYRANEDKVYIRRAGASFEEVYPLESPVPVYPGDNIRIPERYF
jgi:polysaccharide export outer membrane protein